MENKNLEPSLIAGSNRTPHQDLDSPNMEQQVNPGFAQSPVHQPKKPSTSELETSFSSKMSASPPSSSTGLKQANGEISPLPTSRESSGVGSSQSSEFDTSMAMPNETVQVPRQYLQSLQQLAMLNPTMSVHNGNLTQNMPPVEPLPVNEFPEVPRGATNVPQNSVKRETMVPTSEIYEEIVNSKMYADVPKLPAPRATCQEPSENSTDSLLRRKKNPIYDESNEVDVPVKPLSPHYAHKSNQHNRYCNKCTCIAFLLIAILSGTSLIITLLVATGVLSLSNNLIAAQTSPSASKQVTQKFIVSGDDSNITDLLSSIQQNMDNRTKLLNERIEVLEARLKNVTENQQLQEDSLSTLSDRLPTGVIDPRLCVHKHYSRIVDDSRATNITTLWVPNYSANDDYKDFVLVAASCTTDNYLATALETKEYMGKTQYRCRCVGIRNTSRSSRCTIDYWMCPTIT